MPHMEWRARGLVAAAGLAAVAGVASLGLAPAAQASIGARVSIGVGVQADPVRLSTAAHAGTSYTLPSLFVVNTGTQTESIGVQVERLSAGPGQAIPPSWIRVGSIGSSLRPKQQVLIPLELAAPANARPGSYRSDIVVTGSDATAAGGVRFGAAAATGLEFSITPGPVQQGWLGLSAWRWWTAGVLILLAAIAIIVRRAGLRIRIETKSSGGRYGT